MVTLIGPKRPFKIYIREWREKFGLTQSDLADRIESNKTSVSRWETGARDTTTQVLAAIAYALGIEVPDLFRHPDQPSADSLLIRASPGQAETAVKLVKTFIDGSKATGTDG